MRIVSLLGIATFGLAALLGGCVAGSPDIDSAEDEDTGEEDVGEAEGAVVGCYGEACNGKDPGAMGCEADATTAATSNIVSPFGTVVGTISIRRSTACNAVWARASTNAGTAYIRAEISRSSAPGVSPASAQAASLSPVSAQRSLMIGRGAGAIHTAKGFTGPSYGNYPNQGQVSQPL